MKRNSHEGTNGKDAEALSAIVVDAAFHIHRELGPGLLESVYETVLARALERLKLRVERQKTVAFEYDGMLFDDGLRVDVLVESTSVRQPSRKDANVS